MYYISYFPNDLLNFSASLMHNHNHNHDCLLTNNIIESIIWNVWLYIWYQVQEGGVCFPANIDISVTECDEYIQIFEYSNILDPNIYSDIRSYHFLDTNIFGYSFVARFWYEYIRIFVCINFRFRWCFCLIFMDITLCLWIFCW